MTDPAAEVTSCPLGLCDGSGFRPLIDYDGPGAHDEDNCWHVGYPEGWWTPDRVKAFFWHYETAHVFGDTTCPWCGPDGVEPRR